MLASSPVTARSFWLVLAALAATLALPAFAQECPAGQRRMAFPADGHFEFWRSTSTGVDLTKEEWWYSESRQKRRERLPFAGGALTEYFDFAEQTLTVVETGPGGEIVRCDQFPTTLTFSRPSAGTACYELVEGANAGGLLPVERWVERVGVLVAREVLAERVGEELIPLRLFNRQSTTIDTLYMNFRATVDDAELELPCTPTVLSGPAEDALRAAETRHGLPPGTLTGTGEGR